MVNDTPVDEYYVQGRGKDIAKVVPAQINQEDLGIAVKKGNTELLGQLNAGLRTIKENGTYAEIYRKWFGKEPLVQGGRSVLNIIEERLAVSNILVLDGAFATELEVRGLSGSDAALSNNKLYWPLDARGHVPPHIPPC